MDLANEQVLVTFDNKDITVFMPTLLNCTIFQFDLLYFSVMLNCLGKVTFAAKENCGPESFLTIGNNVLSIW